MESKAGASGDSFQPPQHAPPPYDTQQQTQQGPSLQQGPSTQQVYMQPATTVGFSAGVTVMPNTIIVGPQIGPKPQPLNCSHCSTQIVSKVEYKPSIRTHLLAALLCLFGCWCCVCIPYFVETCKNVEHQCPNCGVFLGTYKN